MYSKHWFLGFSAFLEFWWYSNIKYVLNAEDLYLVPQKIIERLKVYFFHNQLLKFSYFHDFDGREHTIYAYFQFYFVHISFKNNLTQLFIRSKWPQSVDLSNECNETNTFAVIIENRLSAIIYDNGTQRHYLSKKLHKPLFASKIFTYIRNLWLVV